MSAFPVGRREHRRRFAGGLLVLCAAAGAGCAGLIEARAAGIDVRALNRTWQSWDLVLAFADEAGRPLGELRLALPASHLAAGLARAALDVRFRSLTVRASLFRAGSTQVATTTSASWPGDAGLSASAASHRVLIELGVREGPDGVALVFESAT